MLRFHTQLAIARKDPSRVRRAAPSQHHHATPPTSSDGPDPPAGRSASISLRLPSTCTEAVAAKVIGFGQHSHVILAIGIVAQGPEHAQFLPLGHTRATAPGQADRAPPKVCTRTEFDSLLPE